MTRQASLLHFMRRAGADNAEFVDWMAFQRWSKRRFVRKTARGYMLARCKRKPA
jgi:hypothetical protein